MSNEKFPVFCPYCGAKMLLKNEIFNLQATDGNRARYWYRCRNEGCESRDGEVFEPGWVEDMYVYVRECETINLCSENIDWPKGRCWLRKPTEQEMENTPWEDEGR